MIKISSLNKIYKSKNKQIHPALKDINLVLPDNGLVFLLGKSGSGKSTLLNICSCRNLLDCSNDKNMQP